MEVPVAVSSPRPNAVRRLLSLAGRGLLLWTAAALAILGAWLRATFGDITLGQIVFHWRYLGGASSITSEIALDFMVMCVGASSIAALLWLWIERRVVRLQARRAGGRWLTRVASALPAIVIAASTALLASRTSAVQFLSPHDDNDYFAANYLPPEQVRLVPGERKNLVLVYVESLETSYRRSDVFGRNLLASLDALDPVSFERYVQMPGTGWTIAAMVATQCGVPLEPVGVLDAHDQGERTEAFLPQATCLGDLLAAQGYRNVFLGGAQLSFSGKGKFLRDHHYSDTWGVDEWIAHGIPQSRISGWGVHDDDLFEQAKAKLRELHAEMRASGRPFNLTMLTVDTHWPAGYLSPGCHGRGARELQGIVSCTADQVADLVRFIRAEGYDADTNVVVVGDHLTPPNSLSAKLAQVPQRYIYNAFFSRTPKQPNRDEIVHFDFLPTMLDFIGLHPRGGRMGLGVSGFGAPAAPLPDAATRAEMTEKLLAPSKTYVRLWEPVPKGDAAEP